MPRINKKIEAASVSEYSKAVVNLLMQEGFSNVGSVGGSQSDIAGIQGSNKVNIQIAESGDAMQTAQITINLNGSQKGKFFVTTVKDLESKLPIQLKALNVIPASFTYFMNTDKAKSMIIERINGSKKTRAFGSLKAELGDKPEGAEDTDDEVTVKGEYPMNSDKAWDFIVENTEENDDLYSKVYDWISEDIENTILDAVNNEPDDPNGAAQRADISGWELEKCEDFIAWLKEKGITNAEDIKALAYAYESQYDELMQDRIIEHAAALDESMKENEEVEIDKNASRKR